MSGFTKLFNSILHSTIWSEPDHVRIVWITMLAMADKYGDVHAAVPGLARMAGKSLEDVEDAIGRFQQPDPYSRTSEHEGRRIQAVEGGWHLLNHGKYRELMSVEERKEYNRKKQAERRARLKLSPNVNDNQLPVRDNQQSKHIAEAKAEADSDTKKSRGRFIPPTLEQLNEYGQSLTPPFTKSEKFINFYQQKGWKVGKNSMKDWKAAVRNWHLEDKEKANPKHETRPLF